MRLPELDTADIAYRSLGTTALDRFLELPMSPIVRVGAEAGMVELASIFDKPSFPGLPGWDLLVESGGREVLLRGNDLAEPLPRVAADPLSLFAWEPHRHAFSDPVGLYPILKEARRRIRETLAQRARTLSDVPPVAISEFPGMIDRLTGIDPVSAAVFTARLPLVFPPTFSGIWSDATDHPPLFHRAVLTEILTGPWAERGLELLHETGYLATVVPEIARMEGTEQSKEGHPEGNVWRHTLETLRYRKTRDLVIGLALLLHDSGKPQAFPNGQKKFDGHADIGARTAGTVLSRLSFSEDVIESVRWLVRYHMIPGALRRLPDYRRDPIMASELFPLLLEVYRCDLSSTFRGPENYYDACAVYRRFLKSNRARGQYPTRQLVKLYLE